LHLGGLRTALYNYLFAKHHGGQFLLRIEDTDRARLVPQAAEKLATILDWAGIPYDEGPARPGACGPYVQSERLPIYHQHADMLLQKNAAYRCFCTEQRLEKLREQQARHGLQSVYDRLCANLSEAEVQARVAQGEPFVVRLRIPEGKIKFADGIRGSIEFTNRTVDDQILVKTDGYPTYHLANVVDDHLMGITHVIRGEEWLASTPKHIVIYRSFGWTAPRFYHLPLLLDSNRSKLSKRNNDASVDGYAERGYLPEAVINFVALLGWNPGTEQDVFTLPELVQLFQLDRAQKGGAVVSMQKLDWLNAQHIRRLVDQDLPRAVRLVLPYFRQAYGDLGADTNLIERILRLLKERVHTLVEFAQFSTYCFQEPDFRALRATPLFAEMWHPDHSPEIVRAVLSSLGAVTDADFQDARVLTRYWEALPQPHKVVMLTLRLLLTGMRMGAGIGETMAVLGKSASLKRLQAGLEVFASSAS